MSNFYAGYNKILCKNRSEAIDKLMDEMMAHLDCFGYELPIYNSSKSDVPPRWKLQVLFDHDTHQKRVVLLDCRTKDIRTLYADRVPVRKPTKRIYRGFLEKG